MGFTPFYAEDPVSTCKKILRWGDTLDIPPECAEDLSDDCLDFLLSLIIDVENRLVSTNNPSLRVCVSFEHGGEITRVRTEWKISKTILGSMAWTSMRCAL